MPGTNVDVGVMTKVLQTVLSVFEGGAGQVQSGGVGLLSVLVAIEVIWGGMMWSFLDIQPALRSFLRKIILVGIFTFVVLNWPSLSNTILDGFVWGGQEVSGGRVPAGVMRDPSRIVSGGIQATQLLWGSVADLSLLDGGNSLIILLMGFVGLITLALYFVIAMQVFMTLLEFYIIAAFGVLFLPWGVNSNTKWISERYMGAIVAQGTKLMVLTALVGTLYPILSKMELGPDPSFNDVLALAFGTATIAFVVIRAPSVAGGLMSGSASLQAVDAMGATVAAAASGGSVVSTAASGMGAGGEKATVAATEAVKAGAGAIQSVRGSEGATKSGSSVSEG